MRSEHLPAIFKTTTFEYDGIRIWVDVLERLAHGTQGLREVKAQIRVALSRLADRTLSAGGRSLSRGLTALRRIPWYRRIRQKLWPRCRSVGAIRLAISCSRVSSTASERPATALPRCFYAIEVFRTGLTF